MSNPTLKRDCAKARSPLALRSASPMPPVSDLALLLRTLSPELNGGTYVFSTLKAGQQVPLEDLIALVQEPEGVSVVVEEQRAAAIGLASTFRCAWITLTVNSDLAAVGLTAAFSQALGNAGISCNVVAGTNHDHLFVPVAQAADAIGVLQKLQQLNLRADAQ